MLALLMDFGATLHKEGPDMTFYTSVTMKHCCSPRTTTVCMSVFVLIKISVLFDPLCVSDNMCLSVRVCVCVFVYIENLIGARDEVKDRSTLATMMSQILRLDLNDMV